MVSVDRFNSLKASRPNRQQSGYEYTSPSDMEMGSVHTLESSTLDQFLHQAENVQRGIAEISRNTSELRTLHQKALVDPSANTSEVDRLTSATSTLINRTRTQIKALSSLPVSSRSDAEVHLQNQQSLAAKLMAIAREFSAVQTEAKNAYRGQMSRQYAIARPGATKEEIESTVDHADGPVFQQELLSSRIGEQGRALRAVQSRHEELIKIEKSITELFDLFQEMQELLDTQQIQINTIGEHVEEADRNIGAASQQMTKAIRSAKSSRKMKWALTLLGGVILLVIILVVLNQLGVFNKSSSSSAPAPVATATSKK
ncbi:Plasma membrane t-SNARE, secretory vesicle fusion [Geranomyces variabilis]|uniref:Plasma membrane t-SNARE, secretory vesicle fusion n=1 Tax=Geranomyces variabilis TaxID=109894 RepID=A0AAD5XQ97_9FUNG|nr:Plasma membrane t-SNARE, secretory vesicle fusion [Geranomyces variabilis]